VAQAEAQSGMSVPGRFTRWRRYRRAYLKLVRECDRAGYGLSWARDAAFREQARRAAASSRELSQQ
jgi:hypothetical protein